MSWRTLEEALTRGWGRERAFFCPVHPNTNTPAASVNVEKGVWVCYSCGAKGKVGDEIVIPDDTRLLSALDALEIDSRVYPEAWLDQFSARSEYWESRFTPDAIAHFRLGYDAVKQMPCYPLRDNHGGVLGVVYRNMDPESGRKYIYPRGVKISHYLFAGEPVHTPVVVLTEGATDAIAVWEVGVRGVASYGASLSDTQVAALLRIGPRTVLLGHDQDRAGHRAAEAAAARLGAAGVVTHRLRWDLDDAKDLAALPTETRQKIMGQALALCSTNT